MLVCPPALAADEAEPGATAGPIDNVVVTGSRIRRVASDTPNPVTVIDRTMLEATGNFTIAEALRTLPYNNLGAESLGAFAGARLSLGTTDLRGLGPHRTLTLVNGRRVGMSPQASGQAVNLNNIPTAAVERVEILRDGASAIYGSDAIGGVVNIILREDFDAWESSLALSDAAKGGADERVLSIGGGISGERGHLTFVVEHNQLDSIAEGDRPVAGDPNYLVVYGNPVGDPGTWFAADWFGDGTLVDGPLIADPDCPANRYVDFGDWTTIHPMTGAPSGPVPSSGCSLELSPNSEPFPEITGTRFFGSGRYELRDNIDLTGTLLANDLRGRALVTTGGEFRDAIAADNPINPGFDPGTGTAPWPVSMLYGFHQLGNRVHTIDSSYFGITSSMIVATASGELEFGAQYDIEQDDESVRNLALYSEMRSAIADARFNPFESRNDPLVVDALRYTQRDKSETRVFAADVTWSSQFSLSGSPDVRYVAGAEYRRESYEHVPDAEDLANNVFGWFPGGFELDADRSVTSAYVELDIPVTGSVGLTYAGRYDSYSDPNAGDFTNKVGARWKPNDKVMVRATWSEGFRVASIFESAAPRVPDLAFFVLDTLRCSAAGFVPEHPHCQPIVTITSVDANPALGPETSDHLSAGIVWRPKEDLALSLDLWSIDVDNQIDTLSEQQVLDLEAYGGLPPGSFVERSPAGTILNIVRGRLNLPSVETSGVDVELSWRFPDAPAGDLELFSIWSFLNEYSVKAAPDSPAFDIVGEWNVPAWKSETGVVWSRNNLSANVTAVGTASFADEFEFSPEWWHYNLALTWHAPWRGDVTIGARNITNEIPFSLRHHDYVGRVSYLRYRQQF